jgi:Na+-translocating ferredoxin:NAD+ oxidoreductase RnfG subunit
MNTDDINFAYKVRHALNEQLDDLPAATTDRLAAARQAAMARKKAHVPAKLAQRAARVGFAGKVGALFSSSFNFSAMGRAGAILPLLALVAALAGVYQYEEERRIAELAEIDAAVLSDELPLTAYLDHGFNQYLAQRGQ